MVNSIEPHLWLNLGKLARADKDRVVDTAGYPELNGPEFDVCVKGGLQARHAQLSNHEQEIGLGQIPPHVRH